MDAIRQDLRYAARSIRSRPLYSLLVVTLVALGVGANVAVFDLAYALFRQPLPVAEPDRLVAVYETRDGQGYHPLSYANYLDYRAGSRVFEELASHYSAAPIQTVSGERAELLLGSVVSDNYFSMLGVEPQLGRFFLPAEGRDPGAHPVTVLSDRLWRVWFGADPAVLGTTLSLNGTPFQVVGVAPQGFRGVLVGASNDLWIPSAMSAVGYRWCDAFSRDCTYLHLLGRLAEGRTLTQARAELTVLARRLEAAYPEANRGKGVAVVPAVGAAPGDPRSQRLTTLLGAVAGALLVVACANLAGLLLARNTGRRQEIAVRLSLGASRARIVRQLLAEAVVLALAGGAASFLVASWTRAALVPFYNFDATWLTTSRELPAFLFAVGLALAAGVAFGIGPALGAARLHLPAAMQSRTATLGRRQSRLRAGLVVAQVAVAFTLLVATRLLLGSFDHAVGASPLASDAVLALRLRPRLIGYRVEEARTFQREVIRRLESLPGVVAVGLAQGYPHAPFGSGEEVFLPGDDPAAIPRLPAVAHDAVTPGYFQAIGLPLLRGRDFGAGDRRGAPPVVIVNRALASRLWGEENPTGKSLVAGGVRYQVTGVVADAHPHSVDEPPLPYLYRPYWQLEEAIDSRLCVRVAGDAAGYAELIRREIARSDPLVPVSELSTLRAKVDARFQPLRLAAAVTRSAGGVALLLTAVGLYGLLALSVGQRVREIGIRLALGARARDLLRLVVGGGLRYALLGTALGMPLALALSRLLASFLYGVTLADPVIYAGAALLLLTVALLAAYLPAQRAVDIEPTAALRSE